MWENDLNHFLQVLNEVEKNEENERQAERDTNILDKQNPGKQNKQNKIEDYKL